METKQIIKSINNENLKQTFENFSYIVSTKIKDKLDEKKKEIAKTLFK